MQNLSVIHPVITHLTKSQRRKLYGSETEGIINEQQWYYHYIEKLLALRYTVFKWEDIPEHIPVEYIERLLVLTGSAAFIRDEKFGIQVLAVSSATSWSLYGEVEKFTVEPLPIEGGGAVTNYPMREFTNGVDAVIVRNDPDTNDEMNTISMYAKQLAKIRKQQSVNVDNQETTKIIAVDENTKLSIKKMDTEMRSGAATVIRYKTQQDRRPLTDKDGKAAPPLWEYNTPAEYIAGNLQDLHDSIWSEALTKLGVNNVPIRKKERLITSEAESNKDEVNMNSQLKFEMRERGCERIKEVIGIDIKVERNGMKILSEQEDLEIDVKESGDDARPRGAVEDE